MKITINVDGGNMSAYLAKPEKAGGSTKFPALIVLQEIFGVNQVMRSICDEWAQAGFLALCPDLFWRIEPDIDITDQSKQEWAKAFELFGKFDIEAGMGDIAKAMEWIGKNEECSGLVGAIGFCLGGQLAYLTACRTKIDASIGFYGVNIENRLDEATNIKKPLMLHIAGKDQFVPPEAQDKITKALEGQQGITLYHYPDRDHAFARQGGEHYDRQDSHLAMKRSLDFFNAHLSG